MALVTSFSVTVASTLTAATSEFSATGTFPLSIATTLGYATGTGLNQSDKLFADQNRAITTGATDSLDLAGGLTDPLGVAVTFVKVKGIYIKMYAANTTIVTLTRPAAGVPI